MRNRSKWKFGNGLAVCLGLAAGSLFLAERPAFAEQIAAITDEDARALRDLILEQRRQIEHQRDALDEQSRRIDRLEQELQRRATSSEELERHRGAGAHNSGQSTPGDDGPSSQGQDSAQGNQNGQTQTPGTVGERPEEDQQRPEVAAISEQGGILTPRGTLIFEPSMEFTTTQTNRFVFRGFELAEVVLIGAIEASDADRNAIVPALTLRYGITSRLEVDVKVPWVIRDDRVTNTIVDTSPPTARTTSLTVAGLGDIEFGVHYQLNKSQGRWPYFIANLRVKTTTGRGPFDVTRDSAGIETELTTGSGFWGVEPSITMIFPTEPAVFFGSVGYVWNIPDTVDLTVAGSTFGRVDPGDAIRVSFGMGLSLNDRASFSIGYKHDYIMRSSFEINGVTRRSEDLQSGSLFIGFSYRINPRIAVNITAEGGVTDDAPDARVLIRIPIRLNLLNLVSDSSNSS